MFKRLISIFMTKFGPKAKEKVKEKKHEMKEGELKTGTGKKVKSRKQAVAIEPSEARKEGAKVPLKKNSLQTKKTSSGKKIVASKKSVSGSKKKSTKKT